MTTQSAIDAATYEDLRQIAGADFVGELVDTFLAEAPGMLGDLRRSLAAKDAQRFRRAAHSLKSNANTFGALALGAMARELELSGLDHALAADGAALEALDAEYLRVASALKELRDA